MPGWLAAAGLASQKVKGVVGLAVGITKDWWLGFLEAANPGPVGRLQTSDPGSPGWLGWLVGWLQLAGCCWLAAGTGFLEAFSCNLTRSTPGGVGGY